jgi:hypothetical protein
MTDDTNGQSRTMAILMTVGFLLIGVVGMGVTAVALFDIDTPLTDDADQTRYPDRYGGNGSIDQSKRERGQAGGDSGTDRQDSNVNEQQNNSENRYQNGENPANSGDDQPPPEPYDPDESDLDDPPDFDDSTQSDSGRDCNPEQAPTELEVFLEEMEGTGNRGDPYEITTVCELQAMNADLQAHYILADDIDAFDTEEWNDGKGFTPIGTNESFTGSVDGLFKAIGGLTVNRSDDVGLFADLGATAEIERLGLVEADVRGDNRVGTLAGTVDTQVDLTDIEVDGTARGDGQVGGAVGVNDGLLTDVSSEVTVEANGTAGGLVASNEANGIIDSGTADTDLDATINRTAGAETTGVGGLVGINQGTVTGATVTTTTTITALENEDSTTGQGTGGVVGVSTDGSEIVDTIGEDVDVTATGEAQAAAGFVGRNQGTIEQSQVAGTVLGTAGFVGNNGGVIEDSSAATDVTGKAGFVERNSGRIIASRASGDVTGSDVAGGFALRNTGIITDSSATGAVEATERAGGFLAVNDGGNGQALVNDSVASGDVQTGASSTATGGFAAENGGKLENITTRGDVNGADSVGGLVGTNSGRITDSTASGNVSGIDRVGGAVGTNAEGQTETNVTETTAAGDILVTTDSQGSDDASQFGGFVGVNEAVITQSIATGAVNPSGDSLGIAGGFAGQNDGTLRETQASGNVTADDSAGGFTAVNTDRIVQSAATGAVESAAVAGGLLGRNTGTVTNTFAAGSVSGASAAGGLVGNQDIGGTLERSYWDLNATGQQNATGNNGETTRVEGLETGPMQGESAIQNMDDLDFETTWVTTDSYPRLRDAGAN